MKSLLAISLAFAQVELPDPATQDRCLILGLRGGGVHGAYEVGALQAFTDLLDPADYRYDFVSGVSVGAINGAMVAMAEKGDERSAVQEMYEMYTSMMLNELYEFWPWFFQPFIKNSLLDVTKFHEYAA